MTLMQPDTMVPPAEPDQPATPATTPTEPPKPEPSFATKEDLAKLSGAIENLSLQFRNFGQVQPPAPTVPRGPSLSDLETQLTALDDRLETAVQEGKGIAKIQREREKILQAKIDLQYRSQIDDLRTFGTYAIDQLTDQVVSGQMPFLKIPEVKAAYEQSIRTLPADQRMSPQVRVAAYNYAVGSNMDKVFDLKLQEHLRAKETPAAQPQAPSTPGRSAPSRASDPNRIPDPSEIWGPENMKALEAAGKTPDSYAKSLGYSDFKDWWAKVGKDYSVPGEEK